MTGPPTAQGPGVGGGGGVLRDLQAAAAVERAARQRIADAAAQPGVDAIELGEHRAAHEVVTDRWVSLLRSAAADGHAVAVIARAAGVTPASVHYRLTTPVVSSDGGDVTGGEVRAKAHEPQGVSEHPSGQR